MLVFNYIAIVNAIIFIQNMADKTLLFNIVDCCIDVVLRFDRNSLKSKTLSLIADNSCSQVLVLKDFLVSC